MVQTADDAMPGCSPNEGICADDEDATLSVRMMDERCLRHLVGRLPLAQALWRSDTTEVLVKSFTELYGESVGRSLVKNVTEQLLVAVLDQICAEFEALANEDNTRLNVTNCLCALQCLEHIELEHADTKRLLVHVLFHCALDRLLLSSNLEEGMNEAVKILERLENSKESDCVSNDRAKAVLHIKKCARVGSKTGIKAMVLKAAKVRSEMLSAKEVIENLKRCSQCIVERLGNLWENREANHRNTGANGSGERFAPGLPSETMNDNDEQLTPNVPAKLPVEPLAGPDSVNDVEGTHEEPNDAVASLLGAVVELDKGLQISSDTEPRTLVRSGRKPKSSKKRKKQSDESNSLPSSPDSKRPRVVHNKGGFSKEEDRLLIDGLKAHGWGEWMLLSTRFLNAAPYLRTALQVKDRARYLESKGIIKREQFPVIQRVVRSGPAGGTPRKQKAKAEAEVEAKNSPELEKIESFSSPEDGNNEASVSPSPNPAVKDMALDATKNIVIQPLPERIAANGEETGRDKERICSSPVSNENGHQAGLSENLEKQNVE